MQKVGNFFWLSYCIGLMGGILVTFHRIVLSISNRNYVHYVHKRHRNMRTYIRISMHYVHIRHRNIEEVCISYAQRPHTCTNYQFPSHQVTLYLYCFWIEQKLSHCLNIFKWKQKLLEQREKETIILIIVLNCFIINQYYNFWNLDSATIIICIKNNFLMR